MKGFWILGLALCSVACGNERAATIDSARADSIARVRQDSINRAQPGYVVDSILPIDEQLRRFRKTLVASEQLEGGADSRESLMAAFVRALASSDTAALARLTINRAEFAYLVYPESPYSVEPLQQAPDLVWLRHRSASVTGLRRLLERLAGRPLAYDSVTCDTIPTTEGKNRIWGNCALRYVTSNGATESRKLFAGIIERDRRFKILSYANAF